MLKVKREFYCPFPVQALLDSCQTFLQQHLPTSVVPGYLETAVGPGLDLCPEAPTFPSPYSSFITGNGLLCRHWILAFDLETFLDLPKLAKQHSATAFPVPSFP